MIIMQTDDAVARRKYIESQGLSKVIFDHVEGDVACIQYHPKGIKGSEMALSCAFWRNEPAVLTPDHIRWHDARTRLPCSIA